MSRWDVESIIWKNHFVDFQRFWVVNSEQKESHTLNLYKLKVLVLESNFARQQENQNVQKYRIEKCSELWVLRDLTKLNNFHFVSKKYLKAWDFDVKPAENEYKIRYRKSEQFNQ
jgi:hypothetical protein